MDKYYNTTQILSETTANVTVSNLSLWLVVKECFHWVVLLLWNGLGARLKPIKPTVFLDKHTHICV